MKKAVDLKVDEREDQNEDNRLKMAYHIIKVFHHLLIYITKEISFFISTNKRRRT